ncbi:MAG TPA: M20 family metallopeptidase [Chloroflexota bacterium]|nr:M20 family metallopeptidase [Chloroflexota bacterium]
MDTHNSAETRLLERLAGVDLRALLTELVRRPSFEQEAAVVEYLEARWRALGFATETTEVEPGRCNITVRAGIGGPAFLFNSHMDTVPPGQRERWSTDPFGAEVRNGRLYGRGSVDAKGCLAAMIGAFETLAALEFPGTLLLSAVAIEENGGYGTRCDMARGLRADAALVGEPTNLQPNLGHRGASRLEVECRGRPAHSAQPEEGVNAISAAAEAVRALDALDKRLASRLDPVLRQHPHLTVTMIRGGDAGNVVPARCTLLLDRRTLPTERADAVEAEILDAVRTATSGGSAEVSLVGIRHTAGAVIDPTALIATTLSDAIADVTGNAPAPTGFFACCDMTFLAGAGIPTAIFGPGEQRMCHIFDESLSLADLRQAAQICALTAHRWLQAQR